jgi:predicted SAM-dependent methyltransferase
LSGSIGTGELRVKVNLGCGSQVLDGWLNVDYALGARLAKIPLFRPLNRKLGLFNSDWDQRIYLHDLSKKFPWDDHTIDIVYSSHLLEHLTKTDGRAFIAECHRVLRKGGILRIVVPDLRYIVGEYIEGRILADDFVAHLSLLYENKKNENKRNDMKSRLAPFFQFPHKCMYDAPRLAEILRETGFDVQRKAPFESAISDIKIIELKERTENAVILEGRKQ